MRKSLFAIALLPMLASCATFGWGGDDPITDRPVTESDVQSMATAIERDNYWRGLRRRNNGRSNAFGASFMNISDFVDRHFWNYDVNDPKHDYPSAANSLDHLSRFTLNTVTSVPPVDVIAPR